MSTQKQDLGFKKNAGFLSKYSIGLYIKNIINIDRAEGSLCIKEDSGKNFLADVNVSKLLEWQRLNHPF